MIGWEPRFRRGKPLKSIKIRGVFDSMRSRPAAPRPYLLGEKLCTMGIPGEEFFAKFLCHRQLRYLCKLQREAQMLKSKR